MSALLAGSVAWAQPSQPGGATGAQSPGTPAGPQPAGATATGSSGGERPTTPHDFIDTRITWTFGDDDVLTATGQRVPVSPLPRIGDRPQYQLFFDALNSRFAGRENLTHLAMYARAPGFIPRVSTEAALVLRFDIGQLSTGSGNLNQALYDAGTYLRVGYNVNPTRPQDQLAATFFPFDTDRFRLGYLWDLSWGGNDVFPRRVGPAPGLKLSLDVGSLSLWAGFKSAGIVVPLEVITSSRDIEVVRVDETQYAGLAGLGLRAGELLRFDLSGGWFGQGRFDFPGVRGQQVYLFGASARVVLAQGITSAQSLDMQLYRNDPTTPFVAFRPDTYTPGRVLWALSLESTFLGQNLADIDVPGRTQVQTGLAGALQGRVKAGYFSASLTALYRDVPFLLRNVPSFVPFRTIPPDATVDPELFFAAQADYAFTRAHVVPSLIVGLQLPATFGTTVQEGSLQSQRTLVIRRAGNFSILPPGERAVPIVSARASVRWDLSTIISGIVWLQYVRDQNATLLQVDASGTRQVRIFQAPDQLGFGVTAQARF
ncbi:MAG: hypothetical protein HY909_11010 [Deltaproteobacteria bacterium]|nr:hypothetical protein [Deltaproteobacteria bacterium]